MSDSSILKEKSKIWFLGLLAPLAALLVRWQVHPNTLTWLGLVFSILAGAVYSQGAFFWAGLIVLLAGVCDALDGQLARQTGKNSTFGAFFDSTMDRFSETFIFLGLAWYFSRMPAGGGLAGFSNTLAVLLTLLALAGSFMVSYTRARAEGLGVDCKIGWMQRPERMVLLILASLLSPLAATGVILMVLAVAVIAVMSHLTAVQRIRYVKKQLQRGDAVPKN